MADSIWTHKIWTESGADGRESCLCRHDWAAQRAEIPVWGLGCLVRKRRQVPASDYRKDSRHFIWGWIEIVCEDKKSARWVFRFRSQGDKTWGVMPRRHICFSISSWGIRHGAGRGSMLRTADSMLWQLCYAIHCQAWRERLALRQWRRAAIGGKYPYHIAGPRPSCPNEPPGA